MPRRVRRLVLEGLDSGFRRNDEEVAAAARCPFPPHPGPLPLGEREPDVPQESEAVGRSMGATTGGCSAVMRAGGRGAGGKSAE